MEQSSLHMFQNQPLNINAKISFKLGVHYALTCKNLAYSHKVPRCVVNPFKQTIKETYHETQTHTNYRHHHPSVYQ